MTKIKIKNFGPIKEGYLENDGWMEIKKVTVFIGNQASGKSTVAKVLSTLMWLEKAFNRGEEDYESLTVYSNKQYNPFESHFLNQGIYNYFLDNTEIEYLGEKYSIKYRRKDKFAIIKEIGNNIYVVPKIMYIPAERNILSTINSIYDASGMNYMLYTFGEELRKAQKELNGQKIKLPISDEIEYRYDAPSETSFVVGKDYEINLLNASSGLQSLIPLYLVSKNLAKLVTQKDEVLRKNMNTDLSIRMNEEITSLMVDNKITEEKRNQELNQIRSKYLGKCFINIVEEPEQNLFPTSQWQMLQRLLEFNNMTEANKLIMTTHSPYIINYLSIAIQGAYLKAKIKSDVLLDRLNKIVPVASLISADDVVIYQLDERDGSIKKLPVFEGIPSDKNYLNSSLHEGNQLFDSLLELEEDL
jgi:predicted ATPase